VKDRQGKLYSLRVRPYKNLDNKIDGAVIALFDVDTMGQGMQRIEEALDLVGSVIEGLADPVAVLGESLRIEHANPAFWKAFAGRAERGGDTAFDELGDGRENGDGRSNGQEIRRKLTDLVPGGSAAELMPLEFEGLDGRRRRGVLTARRIESTPGGSKLVVLAFQATGEARAASARDDSR